MSKSPVTQEKTPPFIHEIVFSKVKPLKMRGKLGQAKKLTVFVITPGLQFL